MAETVRSEPASGDVEDLVEAAIAQMNAGQIVRHAVKRALAAEAALRQKEEEIARLQAENEALIGRALSRSEKSC
jgi:ABC-type transport system involved in cytochrome bd biosynthesis fused ATPase/permease subunit